MKIGDLVKYNRLARTFCTVTGERITGKSLGVILEIRCEKAPIIRVHWFQKMRAGWVPFHVLDVL